MRDLVLLYALLIIINFGCKKKSPIQQNEQTPVCSIDSTYIEKANLFTADNKLWLSAGEGASFDFEITGWPLHSCRLKQALGISSILGVNSPQFLTSENALTNLNLEDQYILVQLGDKKKLYPLGDLSIYEIINDELNGKPIMIAYCYLADLIAVYDRKYCETTFEFQATGYTYKDPNYFDGNEVFLLFDKQTRSIWFPGTSEAVSGPLKGNFLSVVQGNDIPRGKLGEMLNLHPDALVLKKNQTSIDRNIPILSGNICF